MQIRIPTIEYGAIMSKILANNIRFLMERTGVKNVNDLSRRTRIAQPTLFRWLAEGSREPRHSGLLPLSEYFEVPIDDLLRKDLRTGEVPEVKNIKGRAYVPIVPWCDVRFYEDYLSGKGVDTWPAIHLALTTRAFATRHEGRAMDPLIPTGAIAIVEPGRAAKSGDYVLLAHTSEGQTNPIIRRLVTETGIHYLVPENPTFETVKMTAEPQILGVVSEVQVVHKL
jgi:phage repressor protein C with HTH and peptisase S24 domain